MTMSKRGGGGWLGKPGERVMMWTLLAFWSHQMRYDEGGSGRRSSVAAGWLSPLSCN